MIENFGVWYQSKENIDVKSWSPVGIKAKGHFHKINFSFSTDCFYFFFSVLPQGPIVDIDMCHYCRTGIVLSGQ